MPLQKTSFLNGCTSRQVDPNAEIEIWVPIDNNNFEKEENPREIPENVVYDANGDHVCCYYSQELMFSYMQLLVASVLMTRLKGKKTKMSEKTERYLKKMCEHPTILIDLQCMLHEKLFMLMPVDHSNVR